MIWSALLLDLVPILVFVVFDRRGKVKLAVAGAVLAAVLELVVSHFFIGGVDELSIVYAALFLAFGGLSYKFNNALFFKLKPVFISVVTGLAFLVTYMRGNPLMVMFLERYKDAFPESIYLFLTPDQLRQIFTRVSFYMIFGSFVHAALLAWAALRASTWMWFIVLYGGGFAIIYLVMQLAISAG